MKKLFCSLAVLFLLTSCSHHTSIHKTYYFKNAKSGKILDEAAYKKIKESSLETLKKIDPNAVFHEVFQDSIVSGDSIIKTYSIEIKMAIGAQQKQDAIFGYLDKKLPAHTFVTLQGKKVSLAQLEGKPTLINFWFVTCMPCIEEIPVLNKIQEKFKGKVNFISITFDTKDQVTKFLKSHPYNFVKIVDAGNYTNKLDIHRYPVNVFLDKKGVVKKVTYGIPLVEKNGKTVIGSGEDFEKYLKTLL